MSKIQKIFISIISITASISIVWILVNSFSTMSNRYTIAESYYEKGSYQQAEEAFHALGNYRNSAERAESARQKYEEVMAVEQQAKEAAMEEARLAEQVAKEAALINISYIHAVEDFELMLYKDAMEIFFKLGSYKDKEDRLPLNYFPPESLINEVITCEQLFFESKYLYANQLLDDKQYETASQYFFELKDYRDSESLYTHSLFFFMPEIQERTFDEALGLMHNEQYIMALELFEKLVSYNYERAKEKVDECRVILKRYSLAQSYSAGGNFSIAITTDDGIKTTFAPLQMYFKSNSELWKDVISVDIGDPIDSYTASNEWALIAIGLTKDGRVICNKRYDIWSDNMSQYTRNLPIKINDIDNAIQVVAGADHIAVLTADGKVYAGGVNTKGQCEVYSLDWTDPQNQVVMIAANTTMTVGLREDGTIITTLNNMNEEIKKLLESERDDWSDIVFITVGGGTSDAFLTDNGHIVAITSKGKAIGVGNNTYGQIELHEWSSDMVFASAGLWHTLGIKIKNNSEITVIGANKDGMFDVQNHLNKLNPDADILYVSAGFGYSLGLISEKDGALKLIHAGYTDFNKVEAETWSNLIAYSEWEYLKTNEIFRKMVLTPIR